MRESLEKDGILLVLQRESVEIAYFIKDLRFSTSLPWKISYGILDHFPSWDLLLRGARLFRGLNRSLLLLFRLDLLFFFQIFRANS